KISVWQIRKCAIDLYRANSRGAGLRIESSAQVRICGKAERRIAAAEGVQDLSSDKRASELTRGGAATDSVSGTVGWVGSSIPEQRVWQAIKSDAKSASENGFVLKEFWTPCEPDLRPEIVEV